MARGGRAGRMGSARLLYTAPATVAAFGYIPHARTGNTESRGFQVPGARNNSRRSASELYDCYAKPAGLPDAG